MSQLLGLGHLMVNERFFRSLSDHAVCKSSGKYIMMECAVYTVHVVI